MLFIKFSFCSDDVKVRLFKSCCTNLYCTQFWFDYSAVFMEKKLSVGYNNILEDLRNWINNVAQVESLFTMAYLPLVNYKGNISQLLSIGFSPVQIELL